MNYTKGEWRLGEAFSFTYRLYSSEKPDSYRIADINAGGSKFTKITLAEAEANAHLIAAAPDMYEALKRLLEKTDLLITEECDHDVGICWCSYKNARFQAAHVVAKAEGKEEK